MLLRHGQPEQPQLPHLLDDLLGKLVAGLELLGHGEDLALHELPDGGDDRLLLLGELDEAARPRFGHPASPLPSGR